MKFKEYESVKNENGTYNILDVPIALTGKNRGIDLGEDFEEIQQEAEENAKNGYFPPLILGHNEEGLEEKPAVGIFSNLKRKGNDIVADLMNISSKVYKAIKNREYPARSIEYNVRKKRIAALALLGGTSPFFKLPNLEIKNSDGSSLFFEDEENTILSYKMNANGELEFINADENNLLNKMQEVLKEGIQAIKNATKQKNSKEEPEMEKFTQEQLDQAKLDGQTEATTKFREDFKKEHGMYPKEFAAKQKQAETDAKKAAVVTFCEKLKTEDRGNGKILSPAVVDDVIQPFMTAEGDVVKFGEEEMNTDAAVEHVIGKIIEFAADDKLFTDMEERSEHSDNGNIRTEFDDDENVDAEDLAIHKKALKYQADKDVTYEQAIEAVTANLK